VIPSIKSERIDLNSGIIFGSKPFLIAEKTMQADYSVEILLLVIAVAVSTIALRPYIAPPAVAAQSIEHGPFYIEPGVAALRAPDGSPTGTGQSRGGSAERKHLGISHSDAKSISRGRSEDYTACLPSLLARQIRVRGHGQVGEAGSLQ